MTARRAVQWAVAALFVGIAAWYFFRVVRVIPNAPLRPSSAPVAAVSPGKSDILKPGVGNPPAVEDATNPLAAELNVPTGTIRRDLEVLNEIFVNFQTNFPRTGNPVGENSEITAALTGANPAAFAFIPKKHPAINAAGELCDRWGTPFHFHQLSGTQMEIRSAGPDKKFGTADDVEFAPWPK